MILELHVQPGASRTEFLAAHFKVPKSRVRIASGVKSRQKRVIVDA